jgi:hypothetical protein
VQAAAPAATSCIGCCRRLGRCWLLVLLLVLQLLLLLVIP